jgi:hypothetical protein
MSDASRRHVTLPALLSFFLRATPFPLMKPWRKFVLVAAVCGFVGYVTVFVAPRRDMITQRGNSSRAFHLAQDIREEDSNFLATESRAVAAPIVKLVIIAISCDRYALPSRRTLSLIF